MSSTQKTLNWLRFLDWQTRLPTMGREAWVVIHDQVHETSENYGIFCALIPLEKTQEVLTRPSWDLSIGSGGPACIVEYDGEQETAAYYRFGSDDGIEPLVIHRDYHGLRSPAIELSEEFRLFHNLYFDVRTNAYLRFDDNGDDEPCVVFEGNRIRVRLQAIRQFLAIKDMALAVYFDAHRFTPVTLADLGIEQSESTIETHEMRVIQHIADFRWASSSSEKRNTHARFLGKKLILGTDKSSCGFWPFENEEKQFADFIIGVDSDGNDRFYRSDPDSLANYFGKNPEAPHYLTPVFFRREVLDKYYANPARFRVEDGHIQCGNLWSMRIDNNHDTHVVAYLGDLGRDLHYKEQLYWKNFNISPEGGVSDVEFRRAFLAEFADPSKADLLFKQQLAIFRADWRARFEWDLFMPLEANDEHFETTLRLPSKEDHAEFDQQILSLTKILVDSLNEAKIQSSLTERLAEVKGISKLERFLADAGVTGADPHIRYLRAIQDLRSSSVAHRKGKNFRKAAELFRLEELGLIGAFREILQSATSLLDFLHASFLL